MREWLKELRIAKQMTQTEVAALLGKTPQYYNYIENGLRCPKPKAAKQIAEVLDFDWTRFYEDLEA